MVGIKESQTFVVNGFLEWLKIEQARLHPEHRIWDDIKVPSSALATEIDEPLCKVM